MEWLKGGAILLTAMQVVNSIEMDGMREIRGSLKDESI